MSKPTPTPPPAPPAVRPPFADVPESRWYYAAVRFAYERGLLVGMSEGQFAPNRLLSRSMAVTVLHRLAGQPGSGTSIPFGDVPQGSYYEDAVRWAYGKGMVSGRGAADFAPEQTISRQELATMLYRYAKAAGMNVSAGGSLAGFRDGGAVADWAKDAMAWAVASGLIQGRSNGSLDPTGTATRAETAAILARFCEAFTDVPQSS